MDSSVTCDLGLMVTPRASRILLQSETSAGVELRLTGYADRLSELLRTCREERVPPHLGGMLPLAEEQVDAIRLLAEADIPIWTDREFQLQLERLFPGTDLPLRAAIHPPAGTFPVNPWTLVRDPVWRLLAELAIPLPRRLVLAVEEPWASLHRTRDQAGDLFSHFLDSGGAAADLAHPAVQPYPSLAWGLSRVFSNSLFVAPPAAALIGLQAGHPLLRPTLPARWFLVHAGAALTTVWVLKGSQIRAGLAHRTDRLTPAKLGDYLIQLASGHDLNSEVRLDGGLFAATRLLPEEEGPWRPVIVTGPGAEPLAPCADGWPQEPSSRDWEAEGLRLLLVRPGCRAAARLLATDTPPPSGSVN
ncbi:MAG TPA: DUF1786 family protein [Acidobacteriota bacterium]|nr:DUF1786 family protein [Acidobacteriota bacterium]HQM62286.1 DUF1786 family protein [Acidobacteriota bacterium]